jgi:serine/threonine protein kinase
MAQISELVGPLPISMALAGTNSRKLYTPEGQLRNIKSLKMWPLRDVLAEKYKFQEYEAEEIADFLGGMLVPVPEQRSTAAQCLEHHWIKDIDLGNFESCLAGWF